MIKRVKEDRDMTEKEKKAAMTKRRKWDAKTKAMIVMQGLKGTPIADICTEHQISQAQYCCQSAKCDCDNISQATFQSGLAQNGTGSVPSL